MVKALLILDMGISSMKSALVLEDVKEVREGLKTRLAQAFNDIQVQTACSLESAYNLIQQQTFDLALIDLSLPDGKGVDLIAHLSQSQPQTQCIVVTLYDDDQHLFAALHAGACGYLLKDMPSTQFIAQLQALERGEPPLSPAIARRMIRHFNQQSAQPQNDLTPREEEVLRLIAKGYTLNQVAGLLELSPHTVSGYIKTLYRKLDIRTRAEATLEAARLGLVQP